MVDDKKAEVKKPDKKVEDKQPELKKIIRLAKVDLQGEDKIINALRNIKGISFMFSNALLQALNINPETTVGSLTNDQLESIKKGLDNPSSIGLPDWILNRRFDPETGEYKHLYGPDIALQLRFDIKRMQSVKSYKGLRHAVGLKVRGQRTKSHPRKGSAMGVKKKKSMPAKAAPEKKAAPAAEKKGGKS